MTRYLSTATIAATLLISGCAATSDNFATADRDGDGKLSKGEVEQALLTTIYSNGDPDGDGKISFAEYSIVDPDYPKSRFNARDLDRDGYVTPQELDRFAEKNNSFDRLIEAFDGDNDGYIDRDEAAVFNSHLMQAPGDNPLQKLYHLNNSIQQGGK